MPDVTFQQLRRLSPSAFKLYHFFLDRVQATHCASLPLSLAELGYQSGLQAPCLYPALRHGRDGQVRNALRELIDIGLIERNGLCGRLRW